LNFCEEPTKLDDEENPDLTVQYVDEFKGRKQEPQKEKQKPQGIFFISLPHLIH